MENIAIANMNIFIFYLTTRIPFIMVVLIICSKALEHGFRLKKDMNTKHPKFKFYDNLFHGFSAFTEFLFLISIFLLVLYPNYIDVQFFKNCFIYYVIFRFSIFDIIVNYVNSDNRPLNYLRTTYFWFQLCHKILNFFYNLLGVKFPKLLFKLKLIKFCEEKNPYDIDKTKSFVWTIKYFALAGCLIYMIFY